MPKELVKRVYHSPPYSQDELPNLNLGRGVGNVVQNFVPNNYNYNGSNTRPGVEISALRTNITTTVDNSRILWRLYMVFEVHQDNVFVLQRVANGVTTEIGSGNPAGSSAYGFAVAPYSHGGNNNSTPNFLDCVFLDEPNLPEGTNISYRIRRYGNNTGTFFLNRSANGRLDPAYERGSSSVILTEILV